MGLDMGECRRPRSIPMRKFRGRANSEKLPLDEVTGLPTPPKYLMLRHGKWIDGRVGSESNDPDWAFDGDSPPPIPQPVNESDGGG